MDYFNQQSARIIYRKLKQSDVKSWAEFFVDNPNLPFLGIPADYTLDEMPVKWLEKQFVRYQQTGFGQLAAICKQSGEMIGQTGILVKEINGVTEYEIAYSIKPKFWRQGYGSELSQTMKRFAIEHKINHRVISIVHQDNIGSRKVAQKNGMKELFKIDYMEMPCVVYGVAL